MSKILTVLSMILIFSCGHSREKIKEVSRDVVESYGRGGEDLVESFYRQLIEKSAELKKLDEEVNAFRANPRLANETANKYTQKSSSYYQSAESKTASISDSLLRKKMLVLIKSSKKSYATKTVGLDSLLNGISKNDVAINDQYTILKIVLTLPLIEKYQDENLPNTKGLKELIKEQEKVLKSIEHLCPK